MKKSVMKFGVGVLGLVIVGGAVWYGVLLYQERQSPEYALMREYKKLSEAYKNDTYGGVTPEETLRLFIDALKAGDTELAAKYFVVEEQVKWKTKLLDIKKRDVLKFMIEDLEKLEETKRTEEEVFFVLTNQNNVVSVQMLMIKNSNIQKWKILEL